MQNYKEFFKGKRVTVVGLGLLGKRLGDIAFLAECGADVTVTDLKTADELAPSIKKLGKYKNIKYSLGGHTFDDFEKKDFILKGQGVPLDSPYIAYANKNCIPIEMDESLFMKLAPEVMVIGITGTRGKSTTTMLIYEILKSAGLRVHLGGNIKGTAALPLLSEVKAGDIAVFELSSWQLQGFGEAELYPHISVFTNFMPDHLNYYNNDLKKYFLDKSYIYKFQNPKNFLVLGESMKTLVKGAKAKTIIAQSSIVPKTWKVKLLGVHNLQNIACAIEVARILKIKETIIKKAVESFNGAEGRLELVKEVRGVKIYNDTNATTPAATVAALESFDKPVILILGGMDKGIDVKELNKILDKKTKKIFLTPGSGSDKILNKQADIEKVENLEEAVLKAWKESKKGDVILFSPGFASFNMFKNEYDRGEQFMELSKKLK
ncbi:MAG: UDP-N-acetylmuramoyl-L-alanine--D-glutamate ligase [Candidatus Nomurabacteria bacterium]|nr:UDP-N-acetylmuramoyl-L-alanine--D-glutamate ligase [Candidatus Nomurabacteria bacterium]